MLLVDIRDGRAQSVQGQVVLRPALGEMTLAAQGDEGALEGEFQQEQLETHTAPVHLMADLEDQVRHWRREADAAARQAHCRVAALASPPLPTGPTPAAGERYQRIRERYQLVAREQLSCGLHIHVSIESDEEAVGVLDRIRSWLPVLLALSANSPFTDGEDSGFQSWRSQVMRAWPSSGPTPLTGSARAYHQLVRDMTASTVLLDEGMVYFDARLSQRYPTVEIRSPDVCLRVDDTVVLAALARGLVETAAAEWAAGHPAPEVSTIMVGLASFQASRHGMTGDLLDPLTFRPRSAWEVVDALLEWIRPALQANGDWPRVEAGLERIRAEGSGADVQRTTFDRTGQLVDVVAQAVRLTAGQE